MKTMVYVNPMFSRFFDDEEFQAFVRESLKTEDQITYHSLDMEKLMEVVKNDEMFGECLSSPMFYNGIAAYQYECARKQDGVHVNSAFVGLTTQPDVWINAIQNTFDFVTVLDISYQSYVALCDKYGTEEPVEEDIFTGYTQAVVNILAAIHGMPEGSILH